MICLLLKNIHLNMVPNEIFINLLLQHFFSDNKMLSISAAIRRRRVLNLFGPSGAVMINLALT